MTAPGDPPPPAPRGPLRWCFEHRDTGRLTIAQWPNLPLWIFLAGLLVQELLQPTGQARTVAIVVTAVALAWWALDEMIRGCNPWRRFLGAAVLAFQVWYFWPLR